MTTEKPTSSQSMPSIEGNAPKRPILKIVGGTEHNPGGPFDLSQCQVVTTDRVEVEQQISSDTLDTATDELARKETEVINYRIAKIASRRGWPTETLHLASHVVNHIKAFRGQDEPRLSVYTYQGLPFLKVELEIDMEFLSQTLSTRGSSIKTSITLTELIQRQP